MTGKKGRWILGISLAALLAVAGGSQVFFLARYPYFRKYAAQNGVTLREAREAWGHPDAISEQMMGLAVEASLENWDKVAELASEDRKTLVGTYYYNLANAHRGQLADRLMDYYQPFERGLFLPVGEKSTPFQIGCAGDVWFALGDMSMAERDAMLGMLFSPSHTGSRYLRRLAETNLVTGDYEAASKYLRMLLNSPRDRKWAREHLPEAWSPQYAARIEQKRALLPHFDLVHGMDQTQLILRILLNSNPSNRMALDYLLCDQGPGRFRGGLRSFADRLTPVRGGDAHLPGRQGGHGSGELPALSHLRGDARALQPFRHHLQAGRRVRQEPDRGIRKNLLVLLLLCCAE